MHDRTLRKRLGHLEQEVATIREYYDRAMAYDDRNPEAALMMARKAAEAICRTIWEAELSQPLKKPMLENLIARLSGEKIIPPRMVAPLKAIQAYGNFGVHDQGGTGRALEANDVRPCLASLSTVVSWYFEEYLPARGEAGAEGGRLPRTRFAAVRRALGRPGPLPWLLRLLLFAAVGTVLWVALVAFLHRIEALLAASRSDVEPVILQVEGSELEALSRLKNVLWAYRFDAKIAQSEIVDLVDDGNPEVVVALSQGGEDAGKIAVLNGEGLLRWECDTTAPSVYTGGASDRLTAERFCFAALGSGTEKHIISSSIDSHGWYPCRICVIDSGGSVTGSYWHPGHIWHIVVGPEEPDGPVRVVLGGINNDLRPEYEGEGNLSGVFLLDPCDMQGEAPPCLGAIGRGSHLWYGVLLPRGTGISRLDVGDYNGDGSNEICLWASTADIFYLSFTGAVLWTAGGDGAQDRASFELLPAR